MHGSVEMLSRGLESDYVDVQLGEWWPTVMHNRAKPPENFWMPFLSLEEAKFLGHF